MEYSVGWWDRRLEGIEDWGCGCVVGESGGNGWVGKTKEREGQ